MIAVIAERSDLPVVQEFFELFKTPWEFYREGPQYDVLLCASAIEVQKHTAPLTVIYGGPKARFDDANDCGRTPPKTCGRLLSYKGGCLPLYFDTITFPPHGSDLLVDQESLRPVVQETRQNGTTLVRVGSTCFARSAIY